MRDGNLVKNFPERDREPHQATNVNDNCQREETRQGQFSPSYRQIVRRCLVENIYLDAQVVVSRNDTAIKFVIQFQAIYRGFRWDMLHAL